MCLAFLALPVSGAGAATGSSPPSTRMIQIGPLKVGHGFALTITDICGKGGVATAELVKGGRGYTISHYYNYYKSDRGSSCRTSNKLKSGSMTLTWGSLVKVKLNFSQAGPLKRLANPGCGGARSHYREATGTGSLKMAIHPGVFGKLNLHKVKAQLQSYRGYCTGAVPGGTSLGASWEKGNAGLDAYVNSRGKRLVDAYAPDNPSHKVVGSTSDVFRGQRLFTFASNLSSGQIHGFDRFLTGSLQYTASDQCTQGSTSGKLAGKLVLHDPVTGRTVYRGGRASLPYMFNAHGTC